MRAKPCGVKAVCLSLILSLAPAAAQGPPQTARKPQTITTAARTVKAALPTAGRAGRKVEALAAFVVTEARPDDTVTGTLVFNLPEESRRLIAEGAGKQLPDIPPSVAEPGLTVAFEKGAACPEIALEIPAREVGAGGVALKFDRFDLRLVETPQELPRLFCVWTRQINARHEHRQGVLRRINRLLKGEED
jgi:hypothetical protein